MSSQSPPASDTEPRRAAVYARKSNEDDDGIQTQFRMCIRQAEADGYVVPEGPNFRFADNDISGADVERPDLDDLLELVMSSQTPFSRLYVREVGRFGRWDDPRQRYFLEMLMERHGVEIWYLKGANVDLDDGVTSENLGDVMVDFMDTLFASKERRDTRWRTMLGQRARFINGFWPRGHAPYGTERWLANAQTRKLIAPVGGGGRSAHPSKCHFRLNWATDGSKEIVGKIFRWVDEENASYRKIAARLNDEGITPPSGDPDGAWNGTTVRRILNQPLYCGDAIWGRTASDQEPVPAEEAVADPDESRSPILYRGFMPGEPPVCRARFQSVQKIVEERATKGHGRGPKAKYMLSGLLRCGHCGAAWSGHTSTAREDWRRTYYRHNHRTECPDSDRRYIRTSDLDEAVLGHLFTGLAPGELDDRIREELERLRGRNRASDREAQIAELEEQIEADRKALARLQEELAYAESEEIRATRKETIRTIDRRLEQRKQARAELEAETQRVDAASDRCERVVELLEDKTALLRTASRERRKEILGTILDEIQIFPDEQRLVVITRAL